MPAIASRAFGNALQEPPEPLPWWELAGAPALPGGVCAPE
jgi:hypothetical protein